MSTYPGGVFDDALPEGRAAATITVWRHGVEARLEAGKVYTIRSEVLRLERGGSTGRMLFIRGQDPRLTLFSEAPGLLEEIGTTSGLEARNAVATLTAEVAKTRRATLSLWLIAAAVLVVLGLVTPPLFRVAVDGAVGQLPLSLDVKLGELASSEITSFGPAITDERAAGLATEILERLRPHLPPDIAALDLKITVIESAEVNAFALPGGRMAVLSGLLKRADDVNMVAAVFAHELMHVRHRHGMRALVQSAGVLGLISVIFGDATGVVALLAQGGALATLTHYGREHESQADLDGVALTAAAGFDPAGMPAFFRKLKELAPSSEVQEALSWMSSHPSHEERIAAIEALIPSLTRGDDAPMKHTLEAARAALRGE